MRLVDADELWKQMTELHEKRAEEANMTGNRAVCATWNDAVSLIKSAPTIDAEPVKRGHWIVKPNGYGTCSNCKMCSLDIGGGVDSDYCPNCGAKMTLD